MNDSKEAQELINQNRELYMQIEFGMEVKDFLNSKIGKYLIARAEAERDEAIEELRDADPTNSSIIMQLQSKMKRAEGFQHWLAEVIQLGVSAQEQLIALDRANQDE